MRSIYAISYEIDDIDKCVEEIYEQLYTDQEYMTNTVAIVMCDYECNVELLTEKLSSRLDFPFIGGTGVALFNKNEGYIDSCVSVLVLTADDVQFSVGVSKAFDGEKDLQKVAQTYHNAADGYSETPKVVFSLVGQSEYVSTDDIVRILDMESEHSVVFGGVVSDYFQGDAARVFANGRCQTSGIAMINIYGNVKPLTVSENSADVIKDKTWRVTKSDGHRVYELDGKPALKELRAADFLVEDDDSPARFLCSPFLTSTPAPNGDTVSILRTLQTLNPEDNSATFLADIPNGSELNLAVMGSQVVRESAKKAFDDLIVRLNRDRMYKYSCVFCVSCIARYCFTLADKSAEADGYKGRLFSRMNVSGFYSWGEVGPVKSNKPHVFYNSYNNETFLILAI